MDLVIRLKRPRNADPFEALVLASKRRKKDSDADSSSVEIESVPTILKFAGTLKHQEEDISPHIFKARERVGLKTFDRMKSKDVIKKARTEAKKASKENRLKVVNLSRTSSDVLLDHNYAGSENDCKNNEVTQYTIVDVVHDHETNELKEVQEEEEDGYVYSLYYADAAGDINDGFLDSLISIEPLDISNVPLYDYRVQDDDDQNPDDEDDSNDENNWRNDYPDSDYENERHNGDNSDESVKYKMEHLKLDVTGSEQDLSSDDGEGDLPYGVDADQMLQLGKGYAVYKAKVIKELEDDNYASEVVSSSCEDDE